MIEFQGWILQNGVVNKPDLYAAICQGHRKHVDVVSTVPCVQTLMVKQGGLVSYQQKVGVCQRDFWGLWLERSPVHTFFHNKGIFCYFTSLLVNSGCLH